MEEVHVVTIKTWRKSKYELTVLQACGTEEKAKKFSEKKLLELVSSNSNVLHPPVLSIHKSTVI